MPNRPPLFPSWRSATPLCFASSSPSRCSPGSRMHSYRYIFVPTSIILASAPRAGIHTEMADSDYVYPSVSFPFNKKPPSPEDFHRHPVFVDFLGRVIIESIFFRVENFMTLLISVQLFHSFRSSH